MKQIMKDLYPSLMEEEAKANEDFMQANMDSFENLEAGEEDDLKI